MLDDAPFGAGLRVMVSPRVHGASAWWASVGSGTIHIMVGVTGRSSVDRQNFNQPQIRLYFSIRKIF
ncbi:hypothetical protein AB664_02970 [Brucella anthropi]|uniref:Uncharacterized protein n=1 Tax=Brucella anthropi TaxID=529 RepID=A0A656Z6J7_BRUAN|nr:hypothetical protein AB664_02970 [Brucella anthropi]